MARPQRSCIAILIYRMYNAFKSYFDNRRFILDFVAGIRDVHEKQAGGLDQESMKMATEQEGDLLFVFDGNFGGHGGTLFMATGSKENRNTLNDERG